MKKFFLSLILLGIIAFSSGMYWYQNSSEKLLDLNTNNSQTLDVLPGSSLYTILEDLQEKKWIDSILWFQIFVKIHPQYANIQAGHYTFSKDTNYLQFLEKLQFGKEKTTSITFLEGWRTTEYIDALVSKGFDRTDLESCLQTCIFIYDFLPKNAQAISYEGYFYPDTYQLATNASSKKIFEILLTTFEEKVLSNIKPISQIELYKAIITASMLEREVVTLEDQRLVSGILENRVEAGMSLGIDASVLYALGDWKAELNYQTLDIESPYNTRKFVGYPPGPISHPGLQSIQAAISPKPSQYYYYLTDIEGTVYYAENLAKHNINKVKYIP